ncbi:Tn3 family transposase [Candidatus Fukatsuia symbiotica]|uniref:Tn3 family transposase n=1 Tax=Candidatus Fukatsuia TaxID=1927833 RepID=UPI0019683D60
MLYWILYTQSHIVRKLNSSARYAGLKRALIEYNTLFKSTHVLNLIDNMTLRKAIRTARNRTEAYQQLQGRAGFHFADFLTKNKFTTKIG